MACAMSSRVLLAKASANGCSQWEMSAQAINHPLVEARIHASPSGMRPEVLPVGPLSEVCVRQMIALKVWLVYCACGLGSPALWATFADIAIE